MENIENPTEKNIKYWTDQFNKYMDADTKCDSLIGKITEIKNNFHKLLGDQKDDDIHFYKLLIENSHHYVTSCIKVRKLKFVKDLNHIWKQIDTRFFKSEKQLSVNNEVIQNTTKHIDNLTKPNFQAIMHDYKKISYDIMEAKRKNTSLMWVKNDKINSLHDLANDINDLLIYHLKLITFTVECVELEKNFYCGRD